MNTDVTTKDVVSPMRQYYRQPVNLAKKAVKRTAQQSAAKVGSVSSSS